MTVAEFIRKLEAFDENEEVKFMGYDQTYDTVAAIKVGTYINSPRTYVLVELEDS